MSELYSLPDGWEWNKLGDITTIVGGGTPRTNIQRILEKWILYGYHQQILRKYWRNHKY